jgi:hypothetical protein
MWDTNEFSFGNEMEKVVRYRASLVAQGFTQIPGIDFNKTYSPFMTAITFRHLIPLAVQNRLSMQLMDVVIAYLYGSLDSDIYIYMKVLARIDVPDPKANHKHILREVAEVITWLKIIGQNVVQPIE